MFHIYLYVLLSVYLKLVKCDYKCLCNYNVETPIYNTFSTTSDVIGYMYEFDCKPSASDSGKNGWLAVAFENKLGFAKKDSQLQIQTCPGSIPDEDKLLTKPTPSTIFYTSTDETKTTSKMLSTNSTISLSSTHLMENLTTAHILSSTVPDIATTYTTKMNTTSPITTSLPISTTYSQTNITERQTTTVLSTPQVERTFVNTFTTTMTTNKLMPNVTFSLSTPTVATTAMLAKTTAATTSTASTLDPNVTAPTTVVIATNSTLKSTLPTSTTPNTSSTASTITTSVASTTENASSTPTPATIASTLLALTTSITTTTLTTATPSKTASSTSTTTATSTHFTTAITPMTTTTNWHPTSGLTGMCPTTVQIEAQRNGIQLAQYGQKCYEIIQTKLSWAKAEMVCQGKGGHLADIGSQKEQDFLYHFLKSMKSHTVWLGLHDRNDEERFEWASGSPVVYTNWKHGRKDAFYHNKHDCVYMNLNGTWDDIYCGSDGVSDTYLHSYVCQYGLIGLCPYSIQLQSQHYDTQLTMFGNKCYESVQTKVSWDKANRTCESNGGYLAEIGSQQEQDFLYHFLDSIKSHTVWLGLNDRHAEESFQWTSGNPVIYTNWKPDRKDVINHNRHDCVYMTVNGTWDDIYCGADGLPSTYLHAYVCQYPTSSQSQVIGLPIIG